ncbi:hypothetical protein KsCSTR_16720 [Candidatus Kuenenia stuttgartiensis]|uniref:Uncharacterized protein n=1 Tax=Kuenenia stuttgartiensis TaxID=174633 RepID=A0A6G7GNP0_KUEST|nr:hypothetical protein KsCSTR_16720 [Candidatus Kuenenia stuttgartiensis]
MNVVGFLYLLKPNLIYSRFNETGLLRECQITRIIIKSENICKY